VVTVGQILSYAVRHRYISYNPDRDAEKPKGNGQISKRNIRVLTPSEINIFLKSVEKEKYRVLFMLAIMSSARQDELIGLKWPDINWQNNQIHTKDLQ